MKEGRLLVNPGFILPYLDKDKGFIFHSLDKDCKQVVLGE